MQPTTFNAKYSPETSVHSDFQNSNVCFLCHSQCRSCWDRDISTCYTCSVSNYLYFRKSECLAQYTNVDDPDCMDDNLCTSVCNVLLYFHVAQADTTNAKYTPETGVNTTSYRNTNLCFLCHSLCRTCFDRYATTCYRCSANNYLYMNKVLCVATFAIEQSNCQDDYKCTTSCGDFYFQIPQVDAAISYYTWITSTANVNISTSAVCYLCHAYCKTCYNLTDASCTVCAATYYYWNNVDTSTYSNRCSYYCN